MGKSKQKRKPDEKLKSEERPLSMNIIIGVSCLASVVLAVILGYSSNPKLLEMTRRLSMKSSANRGLARVSSFSPEDIARDRKLAAGLKLNLIRAGDEMKATKTDQLWLSYDDYRDLLSHNSRFFDSSTGEQLRKWPELVSRAPSSAATSAIDITGGGSTEGGSLLRQEWGTGEALDVFFDPGKTPGGAHHGDGAGGTPDKERQSLLSTSLSRDGDGGVPFIWPPVKVGHKVVLKDICGHDVEAAAAAATGAGPCVPPRGTEHPIVLETLGESPKVFYAHNFLSDDEADALVAFAQNPQENPYSLRPSTTGHKSWNQGGEEKTNSQRTSLNGFDVSSPNGLRLKRRAFQLARIDPFFEGMADGIQVLRYAPSQAYVPHTDYFGYQTSPDHNWDSRDGGTNRFATVFLYLSDVEAGGETVFPKANTLHNRTQQLASAGNRDPPPSSESEEKVLSTGSWEEKMAETCSSQFAVNPKKGDALLFYSQQPNGTLDEMSLHGGCPVLSGVKWAANVWIWNGCRYSVCENKPKLK